MQLLIKTIHGNHISRISVGQDIGNASIRGIPYPSSPHAGALVHQHDSFQPDFVTTGQFCRGRPVGSGECQRQQGDYQTAEGQQQPLLDTALLRPFRWRILQEHQRTKGECFLRFAPHQMEQYRAENRESGKREKWGQHAHGDTVSMGAWFAVPEDRDGLIPRVADTRSRFPRNSTNDASRGESVRITW